MTLKVDAHCATATKSAAYIMHELRTQESGPTSGAHDFSNELFEQVELDKSQTYCSKNDQNSHP